MKIRNENNKKLSLLLMILTCCMYGSECQKYNGLYKIEHYREIE